MSTWRNYRDDQWLRLAGAADGDAPCVTAVRSRWNHLLRTALFIAPLLGAAAFLKSPAAIGRTVQPDEIDLEKEMQLSRSLTTLVASAAVSSHATAQNLVANGGFEGSTPTSCNGFVTLGGGSGAIPGWLVNGATSIDWTWSRSNGSCCDWAPEGDRTIDLNGSPAQDGSAVRQFIQTEPGRRYRISLLARANRCCSPIGSVKTLRLTTGPAVTEHQLVVDGESECNFSLWTMLEREWTAVSSESLIELRSLVPGNAGGPIIDAVQVLLVACPGDTDDSGFVNGVDLAIILTNWGVPNPKYPQADTNNDGIVDGADLATVLAGWGACP